MDSIAIRFILGQDANGNWQTGFREVDDTIDAGDIAIFWSKVGFITVSLDDEIQQALGAEDSELTLEPEKPIGLLAQKGFALKDALVNRKIEVIAARHPEHGPVDSDHIFAQPQPGCFPP